MSKGENLKTLNAQSELSLKGGKESNQALVSLIEGFAK